MDQSDHNLRSENVAEATDGVSSALEIEKVKDVLVVKMETPDKHYTSITPLGKGSFGEVHSAHDSLLGREVAIKSLKTQFRKDEAVVDRFLKEARGMSQLEHPNIMPVHEMGVTDDLGVFFTMKKIEGNNLKEILDYLGSNTSYYLSKYPLNVLLEIFLSICNGVAFAHSKGVIHRDLKPANIMIGEFGEVLILDWGLVKSLDTQEGEASPVKLRMDELDEGNNTIDGAISGTPNYMSPEQAEGHVDSVDFQSDVYSLGSILYHILTHLPPFERTQLRKLLDQVKAGNFIAPRKRRPDLKIPRELNAICLKAMSRFQVNRYRSVEHLAEDIRGYIGHREIRAYKAPRYIRFWKKCRRNPIKSSVVAAVLIALGLATTVQNAMLYGSYTNSMEDAEELREATTVLIQEATHTYDQYVSLRSVSMQLTPSKEEIQLKDKLDRMLARVDMGFNLAIGYYEAVPDRYRFSDDVLRGYADVYWQRIEFALYRKDFGLATQYVETVKERYKRAERPFTQKEQHYLLDADRRIQGLGRLEVNAPPGIGEVVVWPLLADGNRMVQDDMLDRHAEFPFTISNIQKGSYILQVTLPDGSWIPYPVFMNPGEEKIVDLEIPEHIPEGTVFIPKGDFLFGGPESRLYRMHTRTLPSYFMKKYEVTVAEYLEFWKSLPTKQEKDACMSRMRYSPRDRRYDDAWNDNGELMDGRLKAAFPVVGITREAANAYCVWKSKQLGLVVRLPAADEWEKAARGVDGRTYVWGNGFSVADNFALTKEGKAAKEKYPFGAPPGKFPSDRSVYSVYDMAGNVREMTNTLVPGSSDVYKIKGGSVSTPEQFLACCYSSDTSMVPSDVGFRYVIEIPEHL